MIKINKIVKNNFKKDIKTKLKWEFAVHSQFYIKKCYFYQINILKANNIHFMNPIPSDIRISLLTKMPVTTININSR